MSFQTFTDSLLMNVWMNKDHKLATHLQFPCKHIAQSIVSRRKMAASMKIVIACINPGKVGSRRLAVQTAKIDTFNDIFTKANTLAKLNYTPESLTSINIFENSKHAHDDGIIVQSDMNIMMWWMI